MIVTRASPSVGYWLRGEDDYVSLHRKSCSEENSEAVCSSFLVLCSLKLWWFSFFYCDFLTIPERDWTHYDSDV